MTDQPDGTWARMINYEPPPREYADTLLAFRDMQLASTFRVQVQADPLGGPNSILTLMRGHHRVKSVLHPVPAGSAIRLGHDSGGGYRVWGADWGQLNNADYNLPEWRSPSWWVEVDGVRVIDVPERETYPPRPPAPKVPLWQRMRQVLREQARADVDRIAARLGYHRADECTGWDE